MPRPRWRHGRRRPKSGPRAQTSIRLQQYVEGNRYVGERLLTESLGVPRSTHGTRWVKLCGDEFWPPQGRIPPDLATGITPTTTLST
jgi:hypothetical protein